ncbi:hypothetical protein [uncultured Tissierella sp.]|uniref:hypothetical protein n=1 Tax=uncultured Tissierella sp. TaxID=448160 RepID=UPI0028042BBD|nr:hypothetical protein [uncultured Tissierella sp.]MDU5081234.1 hypothetical protein [Bacillota bacterium]
MKYEYYKSMLNKEEFIIAKELAALYDDMTHNPIVVNNSDIDRLYASKDKNEYIHHMAREINKRKWRKKRRW